MSRPPLRPIPEVDGPVLGEVAPAVAGRGAFGALRHPNYRLWFAGQLVSLFGSWMQSTAQGFLVFELTRSPAYLGYVVFASSVPSWLFMLKAGVLADRVARRQVLVVTQSAMMALALVLSALTFAGHVQAWHIVALAFGLGVANAFDAPARQAFVTELVAREDLTNAIALNSTMFNTAVALGPAASGVTYAAFGPGWCFLVNALSFLAVIGALSAMRLPPAAPPPDGAKRPSGLGEGLAFVAGHETVRTLIGVIAVVSTVGMGFVTLIPAWATEILRGDATTNGWLQSARGVGALLAALTIASLGRFRFKGKLLTLGTFIFPGLILAFAWARWLPLSLLLLVGAGYGLILIFNLCNSLVQELVPDALRGRVMGIYSLAFFGLLPVGGLLAGLLAEAIGSVWTVTVTSAATLLAAGALALGQPRVREL